MPKDTPVHELFLEAFKFCNIIYGAPPFNFSWRYPKWRRN